MLLLYTELFQNFSTCLRETAPVAAPPPGRLAPRPRQRSAHPPEDLSGHLLTPQSTLTGRACVRSIHSEQPRISEKSWRKRCSTCAQKCSADCPWYARAPHACHPPPPCCCAAADVRSPCARAGGSSRSSLSLRLALVSPTSIRSAAARDGRGLARPGGAAF